MAGESLRALRRGLQRAEGFALFVAVCNSPADRDRFIERLAESMPGVELVRVVLDAGTRDPLHDVLRQTGPEPKGPVMLVGLERAVPSSEKNHPVLWALNLSREHWPEKIAQPVVLWIPEYLLGLLGPEAPDFLSWRSDTIHFPPLSGAAGRLLESRSWAGGTDGRMSAPDRRERIRELQSRLATHGPSDDPVVEAARSFWMTELGNHYHLLGELAEAERMHSGALEIDTQLGHLEHVAADYGNLGLIYRTRGELDQAEATHRQALATHERLGRLEGMARSYTNLGVLYQMRGDLDQAEAMHRKALDIHEQLGHLEGMAADFSNLGLVFGARGDLDQAETMLREALKIHKRLSHLEGMAFDFTSLGVACEQRGDLAGACKLWTEARDLYARIGMPHMVERVEGWLNALPSAKERLKAEDKGN